MKRLLLAFVLSLVACSVIAADGVPLPLPPPPPPTTCPWYNPLCTGGGGPWAR